ncbi:MAG: biotin--[acetyl-CoA-carboxylase] ligase [Alphaproteobacteria bacterium]
MAARKSTVHLPTGYRLISCDSVGSTNDEAKRLALAGEESGAVLWAREQTAGRGRRGRPWVSPPGNLYCSLLLKADWPPFRASQLSFVTALGVCEAIDQLVDRPRVRCKWPNDVLMQGRKLAGVLLESASEQSGQVDWLVLGLGVNIVSHPELPDGDAATDIKTETGVELGVQELLEAFVGCFDNRRRGWEAAGFGPIREAWLERAEGLGEMVRVTIDNEEVDGRFDDLAETGELVLVLANGERRRLSAGDVRYLRAA